MNGQIAPATQTLIRHLRRKSLLQLRLAEHATRIACGLAQVRGDRVTADVCAFEHAAVENELRERGVL